MNISSLKNAPIDLDLISVKEKDLIQMTPVTNTQIFDNRNNFHPEGLFSTTIFGNIGTEYRKRVFSYTDLHATIIHPLIYYAIINLKSFYKQIIDGTTLAIYDKTTKSFEKSTDEKASTGYHFFFSHIEDLVFEETNSDKRKYLISIFKKAIADKSYSLRYHLILPAGMRDYIIDSNGKPQEDEINLLYRKLLFQSSIIDHNLFLKAPESYDSTRASLQKVSLDIFEYLLSLLEGKHKLILDKWLSRKIFNSTRNVLSNSVEQIESVDDDNRLGYNDTLIGLYQFLRALAPKTFYKIKLLLKDVFIENNTFAYLTNIKTLKKEEVLNSHIQKDYDLYTTSEGLDKFIASFSNEDLRHLPLTLNKGKHYLGLIYNDNKYVRFFQDIDDLPSHLSKDKVTPITLSEFLYLAVHDLSGSELGLVTRYPITGYGSIYPCYIKLRTTNVSSRLILLDDNWEPSEIKVSSFPIKNNDFFNTMSVSTAHYGSLGADTDGDTMSLTMATTDEAKTELENFLKTRNFYISPEGKFYFSCNTDTLKAVLAYMT